MNQKQKRFYTAGLSKVLKSQNSNLSPKDREIIVRAIERINSARSNYEVLDLILKLGLLIMGAKELQI